MNLTESPNLTDPLPLLLADASRGSRRAYLQVETLLAAGAITQEQFRAVHGAVLAWRAENDRKRREREQNRTTQAARPEQSCADLMRERFQVAKPDSSPKSLSQMMREKFAVAGATPTIAREG